MKAHRATVHCGRENDRMVLLLGGATAVTSAPFESEEHARQWAETIVKGNLRAGIVAGKTEIREVNCPARHVILVSEIA